MARRLGIGRTTLYKNLS
ncbi:helix-turn-helix domain-containing protein [Corynebacterium sp. ZY180755]